MGTIRPPRRDPWTADIQFDTWHLAIAAEHYRNHSMRALRTMNLIRTLARSLRSEIRGSDDSQALMWATLACGRWAKGFGNVREETRELARQALAEEAAARAPRKSAVVASVASPAPPAVRTRSTTPPARRSAVVASVATPPRRTK